ncbi:MULTISPECIES: YqeG family HAD IIIA-type phosphatase [Breznakia]|uniref:YqeG family HAD IIIA-type phosphatase n=1 Tax=Breznakia blatticola TaxID=1754012 RepID=A0A4R8A6N6_9FIRM|nr:MULTISPECIES: YqeG family HAD IIIA-type phosphatase [Breznakia]MDH6366067.1 HAD superfamily phosphatase (TIGR01668 family) [Breznakia sp. PH1-1]MDH6403001.1 HAD superfamily phosphatase (TIGR01668 family) [Breznakia sp. PF1-11]MDH6410710.1 HAD superfamily phosphatase (TIGR01668 family) [Breznakia sp. PFB1-11]MDH6413233.1 HAD superfamily phosphatase (TIGR01668 family) [Breznakia sp. PFB1-14]MDH6415601.1 HAD superfamily phosphatase (TIGR01668 family) [Breznakia sp. PFB1-4]
MLKYFIPDEYVRSFESIDVDALAKQGFQLMICDIDNTMVAHDQSHPSEAAASFIEKVKQSGMQVCMISNNYKNRVQTFADALHVPFYSFANKPLKRTYKKILRDYHIPANKVVAVGDQLMTDVLGAKRMHMYVIHTAPLVQRDIKATKLNRIFENFVYKRLEKKNILKKGVFDE